MRRFIMPLIVAFGVCGVTVMALAAAIHFQARPTTTDNGTTLSVQGTIAGLSPRGDVTVRVRAIGSGHITCENPSGNEPPGQNRGGQTMPVTVIAEQTIEAGQVSNGTASFDVTTSEPALPSARVAGCPNDNWTAKVDDVTFRTVTVRVLQGGRVVMRRTMSL